MNNKQNTRNFTPSDDALIKEQPVTRIALKTLATNAAYEPRESHASG